MFVGLTGKAGRRGAWLAASLLLLFFEKSNGCTACMPGDSLKGKYDLHDPRNPDCPCHKYQQLAENEYRQMQTGGNQGESYSSAAVSTGGTRPGRQSIHVIFRKQRKRIGHAMANRYGLSFEKRRHWRRSFRTSDCFAWD